MGYSKDLYDRHQDVFDSFWRHPFLEGLKDGTLSSERLLHYVGQDHLYLNAFVNCYGLGLALSPDREWMEFFHENVRFLLEDETHPHHVLCKAASVSYEEAQVDRLAPSAQAYVNHMMEAGRDTLGVLMAALLPCPWTYIWAGARQLSVQPPAPDHPFAGWWEFYGSPESVELLDAFRDRFDSLAEAAGPAERQRMAKAFEASCHHEVRFWEMAWSLERW